MTGTPDVIRAAVEQRFAQVASAPDVEQKFPLGPANAIKLAYDPAEIDALPASVTESFYGVGNPLGLGGVLPGQVVLDLGGEAGLDSLLAARRVGPGQDRRRGAAATMTARPQQPLKASPMAWKKRRPHGDRPGDANQNTPLTICPDCADAHVLLAEAARGLSLLRLETDRGGDTRVALISPTGVDT
jgi:hypothetical protein